MELLTRAFRALSLIQKNRTLEPSLPYVVRPSDKLIRLSRDMLVSPPAWNEVARYNQLKNPDLIVPGQKIDISPRYLKSALAGGKVISAEGDVTLVGNAVLPGAAIVDGSRVKTGANSSAVLELGDGGRIKVLPNSLADVVTNRNYVMRSTKAGGSTNWFSGLMRLATGTLEALASKVSQRATPLQIETPTSLVGVRGTEFRVACDNPASNSARTEVIEGKVRADNPAQQVSAEPPGNWPMPALTGATAYRVQVASADKFDKIVRELKVTSDSADLASLANDNWFARVRGIDGVGLEGFDTVKLITVKDGQWRVSYSSLSLVNGKTVLSWIGQQASGQAMTGSSYTALLARDQALTQGQLTMAGTGSAPRLELGDLKPGVYFIRLQSNSGVSSDIYRFEIPSTQGQERVRPDNFAAARQVACSKPARLFTDQLVELVGLKSFQQRRVLGHTIARLCRLVVR